MGRLVRRVLEGYDAVAEWSPDDPSSLEAAQVRLQEALDTGYMAVTMPMGGG
jgi:hypothetical protein